MILTLIINGSTTKSLLDYLGVTTLSLGKLHDMAHVVRNLTAARVRTIIALKHDRFLADANWEIVHRFTHIQDPYANVCSKSCLIKFMQNLENIILVILVRIRKRETLKKKPPQLKNNRMKTRQKI